MDVDWHVIPFNKPDSFLIFLNEGTSSYARTLNYRLEQMPSRDQVMSYLVLVARAVVSSKQSKDVLYSSIGHMKACGSMAKMMVNNPDYMKHVFEEGFLARPIAEIPTMFLRCDVQKRVVVTKNFLCHAQESGQEVSNRRMEFILGFSMDKNYIDERMVYELSVDSDNDAAKVVDFSLHQFLKRDLSDVLPCSSSDIVRNIGDDLLCDAAIGYAKDKELFNAKPRSLSYASKRFPSFPATRSQ